MGIGDDNSDKISFGIGVESNSSTTIKDYHKITVTRKNGDHLGTEKIYFYDPIIETQFGSQYIVKEYSTGIVTFGITVI